MLEGRDGATLARQALHSYLPDVRPIDPRARTHFGAHAHRNTNRGTRPRIHKRGPHPRTPTHKPRAKRVIRCAAAINGIGNQMDPTWLRGPVTCRMNPISAMSAPRAHCRLPAGDAGCGKLGLRQDRLGQCKALPATPFTSLGRALPPS